ncbi:protein of unknown function [Candidatus Nitrospira inopinata]|uniref:Uncharacterized protein n=1 Tax=Candidatus Nitrospira inopinata TaxID=1715989 RepID=A0A0S4KYD9_9BACT|nr:protein of unknown function [Candidatus Nitrospira inopinata]
MKLTGLTDTFSSIIVAPARKGGRGLKPPQPVVVELCAAECSPREWG